MSPNWSLDAELDRSPGSQGDARACGWCRRRLEATATAAGGRRWCSKRCRQAAYRARRLFVAEGLDDAPRRLAYADPPYPGLAWRYYGREESYAGEVDHRRLLEQLATFNGWALSTSSKALRDVLPLCPPEARVCSWVKPIGASPRTRGPHSTWEPLIVMPARLRRPGVRDWLSAQPGRGGGETLMGRKPLAFCAWLFELLGAAPQDELVDLFPGTGIVGRAWGEFQATGANP